MNPFRGRADLLPSPEAPSDAVREAVGEMVRQFADPYAFLREFVQNSLDAGATTIDVLLRYDAPERGGQGSLRVSVTDDGSGMNPDTLQRCLLVLFRSSKEGDDSKIGRFGVGFFSVFAAQPERVIVETGEGTGGWRVELRPDYTWELSTIPPRRGTTVTAVIPSDLPTARRLVDRAVESLRWWCPHVRAALHLRTLDVLGGAELDLRLDTPFDLDVPVRVRADDAREKISVVVGLSERPRLMFFNRGILLHVADNAPDAVWEARIESPRLHHTLSRDDVKRDAAYERCVNLAKRTAERPLRDAFVRALRDAVAVRAGDRVRGDEGDPATLGRMLAFALRKPWKLTADEVAAPLLHPTDGTDPSAPWLPLGRLSPRGAPKLVAHARDALTAALSRRGTPIVDAAAAPDGVITALLELYAGGANDAHAQHLLLAPIPDALLAPEALAVLASLRALGGPRIAWVEPTGALSGRLAFVMDSGERTTLVHVGERGSFKLGAERWMGLSLAHPSAAAAVKAGERDPLVAAWILCRCAWTELAVLDEARDAALTERVVTLAVT